MVRVVELWRFPVKSFGGESLSGVAVGEFGLEGDRHWAVRNLQTGHLLTARREPKLLFARASLVAGGDVRIELPHGHSDLSEWLGYPVELVRATDGVEPIYENPLDVENEADWMRWTGPKEVFHDSARTRLSLVSTGTLGGWDARRFRTNVIVDGTGEDELVGRPVRIGTVEVQVTKRVGRCVMVTRAQPDVDRDLEVLRTLNREREGTLSIGCTVTTPGTINVGDAVEAL